MNAFADLLQKKFVPLANRFANLSFMIVLRNSITAIMPLVIVGAIGTFLANLPFEAAANLIQPFVPFLNAMGTVTSSIVGLIVTVSIGYNAANHYELDSISGMTVALSSFLAATLTKDLTFNTSVFGSSGIFTAIIVGFLSVNLIRLCKKYRIEIRMPKGVPPLVEKSFATITSLAIAVTLFLFLNVVLNIDVNQLIMNLLSPLLVGLNTLPGLLIYVILSSLLFSCGINTAVISGAIFPIFAMNSEINLALVAAGQAPTQFVTWGMTTFWMAGGCGYCIGLTILMLFSKCKQYKTLGKLSIIPAIFNINEPVIFGLPIMFNPIMIIPFILVPAILITITWVLMSSGIIAVAYIDIPWTCPPILGAYLSSAGDLRTTIWGALCIMISAIGYYPFFKIMERQAIAEETENEILKA